MPTEAQLRDAALRQRIRHLLDASTLPVMLPTVIYAGLWIWRARLLRLLADY